MYMNLFFFDRSEKTLAKKRRLILKSGEPVSGAPKVEPKNLSEIELNTLENYDLESKRRPKKGSPPERPPEMTSQNHKKQEKRWFP